MSDKNKIIKTFKAEIKSVNVETFSVDAVVSTKQVDRDGEVVLPSALKKRVKLYKEHPVLLSSHNYNNLRSQIGEAEKIKFNDDSVEIRFKYYVGDGNPEADWAFKLAQKGIASYSIGFIGHGYKDHDEKEYQKSGAWRTYDDVEWLETSQVIIPSNRGALQRSIEEGTEKELCEMVIKAFGDELPDGENTYSWSGFEKEKNSLINDLNEAHEKMERKHQEDLKRLSESSKVTSKILDDIAKEFAKKLDDEIMKDINEPSGHEKEPEAESPKGMLEELLGGMTKAFDERFKSIEEQISDMKNIQSIMSRNLSEINNFFKTYGKKDFVEHYDELLFGSTVNKDNGEPKKETNEGSVTELGNVIKLAFKENFTNGS